MSVPSYIQYEGIPGNVPSGSQQDKCELYEFDHEIRLPTDPRDGTVSGRRQHGFFKAVQEPGKQSPLLAKHLCENLEIPSVTVEHFKPDPSSGDLKVYLTHELKKVKVVSLQQYKLNTCDPNSKSFRDLEVACLMYEEYKIKDTEGNEYTDKWELG